MPDDAALSAKARILLFLLQRICEAPIVQDALAPFLGWTEADVNESIGELLAARIIRCSERSRAVTWIDACALKGGSIASELDMLSSHLNNTAGVKYLALTDAGDSFEHLQVLSGLCRELAECYSIPALHIACALLFRDMLRQRLARSDHEHWKNFIRLAIGMHPYTLPFIGMGRLAATVIAKARGLAFGLGDIRAMTVLDIILGTEVTRKPHDSPDTFFWEAGMRGRHELASLSDWGLQMELSPYLGILDYADGNFQNAMGHLSLRAKNISTPAERILSEQCCLYEGHAANLLGNFHLGTNILRSGLRLATAGNCYMPLPCMRLFLSVGLLAQGELDEALELIDSVLCSQETDTDPALRASASMVLAYYHRLAGRKHISCSVFRQVLTRQDVSLSYYFVRHAPFFMELLYVWEMQGFAPLPGIHLQHEIDAVLREHNRMQKSVALRLAAQIPLARSGCIAQDEKDILPLQGTAVAEKSDAARKALPLLRESLTITQELGLSRERAKNCVLLACAYAELGQKEKMNSMAMEAWSLAELLRQDPWIHILSGLVPSPRQTGQTENRTTAGALYDSLSQALITGNSQTRDQFYHHLLHTACSVFGVARASLLSIRESTAKVVVHAALYISEEEMQGALFASRMGAVEKSMHGEAVFTAIKDPQGKGNLVIICIPLACSEAERFVLYMDGEIFPELAPFLTEETLEHIGRIFSWEMIRFRQKSPSDSVHVPQPGAEDNRHPLIYTGETMRSFLKKADQAAKSDASIMLYGESGTGKELVARRIHEISGRTGPFIAVNLSTLPEDLFENEMQGHERGAFTGAVQKKIGLLELADHGTLFLDEFPDISPRVQIKLLRILQEYSFCRLGGTRIIHSHFRLISATNRDIRKDVSSGKFREDLFYRICAVPLRIPPLRERTEDILPLIRYYMNFFARRYGKPFLRDIDKQSLRKLMDHPWPGNVRELKNAVEHAVIESDDRPFLSVSLPPVSTENCEQARADEESEQIPSHGTEKEQGQEAQKQSPFLPDLLRGEMPTLKELEERYIMAVMEYTGRKIDGSHGAAAILGMKKANLYYRLGKIREKQERFERQDPATHDL